MNCDPDGDCDSTTIWTVNADGTHLTKVSNMRDYGHDWSPDGTKIVLAAPANFFNGNLDLFVMNADGSGITNSPTALIRKKTCRHGNLLF